MWGDTPADKAAERMFHAGEFKKLARAEDLAEGDADAWLHLAMPYLLRQIEDKHRQHAEVWEGLDLS